MCTCVLALPLVRRLDPSRITSGTRLRAVCGEVQQAGGQVQGSGYRMAAITSAPRPKQHRVLDLFHVVARLSRLEYIDT